MSPIPGAISLPSKAIVVTAAMSFIVIPLIAQDCFAQSRTAPAWYPDSSCSQEYERAGKDCAAQRRTMSAIQQCIQEKVSPQCISQMKNTQNHMNQVLPKCSEINQAFLQKLAACNNSSLDIDSCRKKIRLEYEDKLQAACGGMQ